MDIREVLGDGRLRRWQDGSEPEGLTWEGLPVTTHVGSLIELGSHLPEFKRMPAPRNDHKDVIIRLPVSEDDKGVAVQMVTKSYDLVQHRDVLDAVVEALEGVDLHPRSLKGRLILTPYAERMFLTVQLPGFDFDPGDGHRIVLDVECWNSVDTTTSLMFRLCWRRLVCQNGLRFGLRQERLRQVHFRGQAEPQRIREFLEDRFDRVEAERDVYRRWTHRTVTEDQIRDWVDGPVNQAWKSHLAARAFFIIRTGHDGALVNRFDDSLPHARAIRPTLPVPGVQAPVRSVFAASQVLSWLAMKQGTLLGRYEKLAQIPTLIEPLLS